MSGGSLPVEPLERDPDDPAEPGWIEGQTAYVASLARRVRLAEAERRRAVEELQQASARLERARRVLREDAGDG